MEGLTTAHSRGRTKDLRHAGRNSTSTTQSDLIGGFSIWRRELEDKRVLTGFTIDRVSYRPASEREQAHTGKAWVAFDSPCEGGGDLQEDLPRLIRMGWHAEAGRKTTVGDREADVQGFAFDALADIDDPRAQKIVAWVRDHRVSGQTLVVTTCADTRELLGVQTKNRSMTTCTKTPLYCRSRTDFHSFGQPVGPKPAVPPDDQIYRFPSSPPRHG
jgi:hypothetical protein